MIVDRSGLPFCSQECGWSYDMRLRALQAEQQRQQYLEQQAVAAYRELQELELQQELQGQRAELGQQVEEKRAESEAQWRHQPAARRRPFSSPAWGDSSPVSIAVEPSVPSAPSNFAHAPRCLSMAVPVSAGKPPMKPKRHSRFSERGSCHALLDFAESLGGFHV
jgi:hypothetical protein